MQFSPGRKRPPLERAYPYTRAQWVLEGLSAALLLGALLALILTLPHLPERVPVHFRLDGTPNRFGSPLELVWIWVTLLGMYLGLGALAWRLHRMWPYIHNMPDPSVLERDPQWAYPSVRTLLLGLRLLVCVILALVLAQGLLLAMGSKLVFWWLIAGMLMLMFVQFGFWTVRVSARSSGKQ